MKRMLITGVGGFVARYFIEFLTQEKAQIEILGLDIADNIVIDYDNFIYKKVDLKNFDLVRFIINDFKPDYILHLAAISSVSQSWKEPSNAFVNNTNIFLNILESIRELSLKTRILSIGSSEEYGNQPKENMPLKENSSIFPCSPYAVARVSQEMLSSIYAKYYGVNIVMTRSFNHIGPRQKDIFVIPSFVKQLCEIKKGNQTKIEVGNIDIVRDFLDVRDVVRAYWNLLLYGKVGEIYNVCSGKGVSLREVINLLSQILKIEPMIEVDQSRIRPDDNMIIVGDNSKLKKDTGWEASISLSQTLQDMIQERM